MTLQDKALAAALVALVALVAASYPQPSARERCIAERGDMALVCRDPALAGEMLEMYDN